MPEDVSKKKEHGEAPGPLDLGLSFLLNAELSAPAQPPPLESHSAELQEASTFGTPLLEPETPYERLASSGSWSEILKIAESELSATDDPVVRTWWIYAHLQKRSMPASFLAAPLESLLTKNTVEAYPANRALLQRTAQLVHRRLVEGGDATLAQAVASSIASARLPATEEALLSHASPSGEQSAVSAARVETDSPGVLWGTETVQRAPQLRSIGVAVGVLLSLLGAVAIFFAYDVRQIFGSEVAIAAETFVSQNEQPELLIPALDRRDLVGRLSALYYSIDTPAGDNGPEESGRHVGTSEVSTVATKVGGDQDGASKSSSSSGSGASSGSGDRAGAQANLNASPTTEEPKPSSAAQPEPPTTVAPKLPKERVNTTSPVEGPEFRDRASRGRGGNSGPSRTNTPRGGRQDEGSRRPQRDPPRPEIIMGMPEPAAVHGRYYTVLASCSVLDAPNYSALVVSQLRRGETVFVEARVGGWLRLRSRNGRGGFVLAQDLVEESPEGRRER